MITRISRTLVRSRPTSWSTRYLSTQSSPSPKISAVEFQLDPEDAKFRLRTFALLASAKPDNFASGALSYLFGSAGVWLSNTFNLGTTLKLKELKAVYYPIWRADVILEGQVSSASRKITSTGWIGFREAYVPGNAFAPLSYLSYAAPELEYDLEPYDPSQSTSYAGLNIVHVPFTASPIGLMNKIEKIAKERSSIQGLTFDLPTWKSTMFACYPIMFPIYIADFEYETNSGETRTMNIVMDAHDPDAGSCRMSCPPTPEVAERTPRLKENYFINPISFSPAQAYFLPFDLPDLTEGSAEEKLDALYDRWMSPKPTSATSIPPSPMVEVEQEEGGVDWQDDRIQAWNESFEENQEFFLASLEARELYDKVKTLERMREKEHSSGPKDLYWIMLRKAYKGDEFVQTMDGMIEDAKKEHMAAKQRVEAARPAWLKVYQERQERQEGSKGSNGEE